MAESEFGSLESLETDRAHASYGKACLSCARSKIRCTTSSTGGKCERCLRLNKDCQPAPTVRKKRASKKPTSSVASVARKTAVLEAKLDDIVQLLELSQTSKSQDGSVTPARYTNDAQNPVQYEVTNERDTPSEDVQNKNHLPYNMAQMPPTPALSCGSIQTQLDPHCFPIGISSSSLPNEYPTESESECEEYLETYRTKMVSFLPVVPLGPQVTVKEMREDRPFLWLVIKAICSKNSARQRALGGEVRKVLAREMLVEGRRSLDLLLGVLVFAGWCHYYICVRPLSITTDIQLGIALASDLGLTKPVPVEPIGIMLNYTAAGCPKQPASIHCPPRTIEERRAMLGLFLVSSVASHFFQRFDPIRWTPYLDECLRFLGEKEDCPTDQLLVYLVRVQLILNKVIAAASTDNYLCGEAGQRLPQDLYMQMFKSQLEELRMSIPPDLQSNEILKLHILNASVCIHEHSLIVSPHKDLSFDPTAKLQRVENLWACLTNVKSLFETFFSLESFPTSCYPQVSMTTFAHLAHCMVALFRLSTFECQGISWDRRRVRQEMDLRDVLKLWVERWESVPAAAGLDADVMNEQNFNPWGHTRRTLLMIGKWWDAKLATMIAAEAEGESGQTLAGDVPLHECGGPRDSELEGINFTDINMDGLDDVWMRDMLGGGYEFFREPYF